MELDWKTLAPAALSFIGVLIGWGLKEISEYFRGSIGERRSRRKGLYQLIRLHHEMIRIERLLEHVKDASGHWKVFEAFRSRYVERYGDRSEEFISGIKSTIEKVGEADPWSAVELRQVLEIYVSLKDTKLESLQHAGFEAYIRGLSAIEATFLTSIKALRMQIYNEARRCGLRTLIRTWLSFRKFDRLGKQTDVLGLGSELKKHFDSINQKNAAPQASSNTPEPPSC
jgi:hypothetical protein